MKMRTGNSHSYLIKEPYSFYFRIKIPKDLQPTIARKELRYSLKTGNLSAAKIKARYLAVQFQLLFRDIKSNKMDLSKEQIQKLLKEYKDRLFEQYDMPVMYGQYSKEMPPETQTQRETEYQWSCGYKEWLLEGLASGNYSEQVIPDWNGDDVSIEKKVDDVLIQQGINPSEINKTSLKYSKLCQGFMRAEMLGVEHYQKRLDGHYSDDFEEALKESSPAPSAVATDEKQLITVKELIPLYIAEGMRDQRWSGKTPGEIESALKAFAELIGEDTAVSAINRDTMVDYKDKLRRLPPANKIPKGMTLPEAVEIEHKKTLAVKTINKRLEFTLSFINFAADRNILQPFSTKRLKIKENQRNVDRRDMFSQDDLKKIFHSKEYLEDSFDLYFRFWGPILALHTGARLDEICQLLLTDFQKHDGVWCIRVYPSGDTKTKNESSERLIPLHPFLTDDLKIIDRVERLRDRGKKRFFHDFKKSKDGYGRKLGRWFNDYLKPIGVYIRIKKTFHSFRHTFTTNLYHNGIREADSKFLDGHSQDGVTFDTYLKRGEMNRLHKALVKHLDYGIDLSHLKNSKYVTK